MLLEHVAARGGEEVHSAPPNTPTGFVVSMGLPLSDACTNWRTWPFDRVQVCATPFAAPAIPPPEAMPMVGLI